MRGMSDKEFSNFHDYAKCKWLKCAAGTGLAGHGFCFFQGEWDNPECPKYITDEDFGEKMRRKHESN